MQRNDGLRSRTTDFSTVNGFVLILTVNVSDRVFVNKQKSMIPIPRREKLSWFALRKVRER